MSAVRIKKNDLVRVIAGKDKGKDGKVLAVKDGKVLVEGIGRRDGCFRGGSVRRLTLNLTVLHTDALDRLTGAIELRSAALKQLRAALITFDALIQSGIAGGHLSCNAFELVECVFKGKLLDIFWSCCIGHDEPALKVLKNSFRRTFQKTGRRPENLQRFKRFILAA